jgi:Flp pilus assembly protein TadD
LTKELYEAYPTNVGFKNGLAISYEKLGQTQSDLGNLEAALGYFEIETKLFEELYEAYPTNVGFKNGLAISYEKLGETQSSLGNLEAAWRFFEERNRLGKELYEANKNNVSFKNGLAVSYYKLGEFSRDNFKDKKKAKTYFLQAETLWKELVRDAPQYVQFQRFLEKVQGILKELS